MGLFDFNGDGKTSSFEYALGMTMMEDIMNDKDTSYSSKPKKKKDKKLFEVPLPVLKENPTVSELREYKSSLKFAVVLNLVFAAISSVLLIMLFCSVPEIIEDNHDGAAGYLGILIVVIPSLIFGGRRIIENVGRFFEGCNKLKETENRK